MLIDSRRNKISVLVMYTNGELQRRKNADVMNRKLANDSARHMYVCMYVRKFISGAH